jgi:T5SS/PEP-CTERM-associated repeat protein
VDLVGDAEAEFTSALHVGYYRAGKLEVKSGSDLASVSGYLGVETGSNGTVNVTGDGSTWTDTGSVFSVGRRGAGTVSIADGGLVTTEVGYIGYYGGSNGTVTVCDTDSKWDDHGELHVGLSGTGRLEFTGGAVTNSIGYVGRYAGSKGTVDVDDAAGAKSTWTNSGALHVGYDGEGTLNITSDDNMESVVTSVSGYLAVEPSSKGTVTVTGVGAKWIDTGGVFSIGRKGTGTLNVTDGGVVTTTVGHIGYFGGSNGTVTVDGAGSTWNNGGGLSVGGSLTAVGGTGTLKVQTGGTVTVADTLKVWSTGTLTLDGGRIEFGTSANLDNTRGGTFNFNSGTLAFLGHLSVDSATPFGAVGSDAISSGRILEVDNSLMVGYGGVGRLDITGGSVGCGVGYLAYNVGSRGTVMVGGDGATWTCGQVFVGTRGTGILEIAAGGAVNDATGYIGPYPDSQGTVTVGGDGATWINGELYVGGAIDAAGGTGRLTVANSGTVTVDHTLKVWDTGTLELTGSQSEINAVSLQVMPGATFAHHNGTLTVNSGNFSPGTLNYTIDGAAAGDLPILKLTDGATCNLSGWICVGGIYDGAIEIRGESSVSSSGISCIGYCETSTGTVTVEGPGSMWNNNGQLRVGGDFGIGTLNITNGGQVENTTGFIGMVGDSNGTVNVHGSGSTWTNDGDLEVGGGGNGTLEILNGGLVSVAGTLTIDRNSYGFSFINMTAGGMLALSGGAEDSLMSFLALIDGTDAIRYWDDSMSDWAPITGATPGIDYTLAYIDGAGGNLDGFTLLTVETISHSIPGDANDDGVVDDKDASILGAHWLQSVSGGFGDGDFNYDGHVNDADAAILAAHWGEGMGEAEVPEPGSLRLLAGMVLMGAVYLRRRKA